MIIAAAPLVLAIAACGSFVIRKRLALVAPFSLGAIALAGLLVAVTACDRPPQ